MGKRPWIVRYYDAEGPTEFVCATDAEIRRKHIGNDPRPIYSGCALDCFPVTSLLQTDELAGLEAYLSGELN